VLVELANGGVTIDEVKAAMKRNSWNKINGLHLPTAPSEPIILRTEEDRPQPRLDRGAGNGMSVSVGRLRLDSSGKVLRYIVLGDNIVRGAAGTGVLIAELFVTLNERGEI
jgi:aspartate-semialdehyde dehydrogenase